MNRAVLKEVLVQNGHSYANDALQGILSRLLPQNPQLILKELRDEKPSAEYYKAVKNQEAMIRTFNSIVGQGKEFALKFINANWSWYNKN